MLNCHAQEVVKLTQIQIHLPVTTLQPNERVTWSQVWLASRALYSSSIARRQFGSARALRTDVGIGESRGSPSVAERAHGRRTPTACRITMGLVW
jgi:hypothetical protein